MNELDFSDFCGTSILLVDDEPFMGDLVQSIVESSGIAIDCVQNLKDAKAVLAKKAIDIAIVDMVLSGESGLDLIHHLKKKQPDISIIVITGFADRDMASTLEDAQIQSVLTKPFSSAQLKFTLCKELVRRRLLMSEGIVRPLESSSSTIGLVGTSPYMQKLREKVQTFARGEMPVLIQGPTGSGKEIIARAVHQLSKRSNKPLIIVNSSAIPEHLEESEFFGHTRGAFTGAHEAKDGIIKCADGSSLFLDEVGELSLRMQAKLLRVLDGHGFTRIGDSAPQKSDFRLISATNRPLLDMIKDGSFRQDLYFRLKAGTIETQPLTAHAEDIAQLVKHFLYEIGKADNKEHLITAEALSALVSYEWPGNIRELKNVVESLCVINNKSKTITRDSIDWVITCTRDENKPCPAPAPFSSAKRDFENNFYISLLTKYHGNITKAATEAGIDRPNFSKKLKQMGIIAGEYKKKG